MQISSIQSTGMAQSVSLLTPRSSQGAEGSTGGSDQAAVGHFSEPGRMFAELAKLKETDPEALKERLGEMASAMATRASETGDARLAEMASKFQQASETGDLSGIEPPQGRPGAGARPPGGPSGQGGPGGAGGAGGMRGGPPPGGQAQGKQGAGSADGGEEAQASDDPADKNGDGVVSIQEQLAYEAQEAESP